MTLDLYDKNGWIGIVARDEGITDLEQPHLSAVLECLQNGGADQELVSEMIDELEGEKGLACTTLLEMLKQAVPPIIISDTSGDPRVEKFDDPNQQPSAEQEEAWAGVEG